jgi:hypothetical protein
MKTNVYIDGFNLYYGCLKGPPHKWLDLASFCPASFPSPRNQINRIRYFTAHIAIHCDEWVRPYLFRFQNPVFDTVGRSHAHIPIFVFTAAVILGWPQLAFALIGGFLSRMFASAKLPDRTRS